MEDLDVVALVRDLPEFNLKAGEIGTIVHVAPSGKGYMVEFTETETTKWSLATVGPTDIRLVESCDARRTTTAVA